jgi:hypothetical protein
MAIKVAIVFVSLGMLAPSPLIVLAWVNLVRPALENGRVLLTSATAVVTLSYALAMAILFWPASWNLPFSEGGRGTVIANVVVAALVVMIGISRRSKAGTFTALSGATVGVCWLFLLALGSAVFAA